MKKIDFDKVIDRRGTNSSKWDGMEQKYPGLDAKGCLPMWVADMDFPCPEEITEAVTQKARFGLYGYECRIGDDFKAAVGGWSARRFGWELQKEWICYSPGIVPAMNLAVEAYTAPGDGVILSTPVYYPFMNAVTNHGRHLVNVPLQRINGRYEYDFASLERAAAGGKNKLLMLCSPHNPVGRVWTKEELVRIGRICKAHHITIFSDEIHADFIFGNRRHLPIASLSEDLREITVTAYAASKTFNVAGLQCSAIVIPNETLRGRFLRQLDAFGTGSPNSFGMTALMTAYNRCGYYVDQLVPYIERNFTYAQDYLERNVPGITLCPCEGTYLAWLDLSGLGLDEEGLQRFMIEQAKVSCDFGGWFGEGGENFMRLNFACPRATLEEALRRLEQAAARLR